MATPDLKALGRYRIERVLGKGAMGVVYEGFDPRLSRRVAIKTILKSHVDESVAKDYSARFVREAQAVGKLNHPHIVQVHDFGEEGEIAYLVLEFIKGRELKSFFDKNERFELKEMVRIMGELCEALDYAHKAGIVHRDVKPGNVMIDGEMRVKLTDFGVARIQESGAAMTQAGTMVGTPAFMSPEQITGKPVDARSDVFSAGIILYQFLTGEMPFTGAGAWTIAKKIMQDDPALPSTLDGAISPVFDHIVSKALAKQPGQRYQSARELGIALKRAYEGKMDDDDKTVLIAPQKPAVAAAAPAAPKPGANTNTGNHDAELEFWRAIKDGNDPEDFKLYIQQFPNGIYAALAKRKITKLLDPNATTDDPSVIGQATRTDPNQRSRIEPVAAQPPRFDDVQQTMRIERTQALPAEPSMVVPPPSSGLGIGKYAAIGVALVAVGGGAWFISKLAYQAPSKPEVVIAPPKAPVLEQGVPADDAVKKEAERLAAEKAEKLAAEKRAAEKLAAEVAARKAELEKKLAAEEAARRLESAKDKATREKLLAEKVAAEKAAAEAKAQVAKLAADKAAAEKAAEAAKFAAAKLAAEKEAAERAAAQRRLEAKVSQEQAAKSAALAEAEKRAAMARAAEEKDKAERAEAEARMRAAKFAEEQKMSAEKDAAARAEAEKIRLAKVQEEQAASAKRPGRTFRDCDAGCPEMVILPAGSFTMGSAESEAGRHGTEGPQHRVGISQVFAVGKFEVTYDEWEACVRDKGCTQNPGFTAWGRGKRPVIDVSWNDAKQYAAWLAKKTGKGYRLLSEAEWEFAARARTTTAFSFGNGITPQQANYDAGVSYAGSPVGAKQNKTVPVGTYGPNAFGLHDMHGNVWEWVEDCWNASYAGAPTDGSAWTGGNCAQRVVRGGSWDSEPQTLRSALRYYFLTSIRSNTVGFRVARALD
ncbi:MAG TPA: bifunctional serine/threonine-protein kinase/formylglycine-generating enzyme family protein [Burkholderiales bacterium]|nr:bifunctional serine/threonine-protein kinase/formylglycine-generating enzyme family protein [Burkholderiales bacterium]